MPKQDLTAPRILHVWFWIRVISLGIRWFGFRRWFRLMIRAAGSGAVPDGPACREMARQTAETVCRVNREMLLFGANCLGESLTLWWLLRRQGIGADLRIGVRTITGTLESHAWVEIDGWVLNDSASIAVVYTPLPITLSFRGNIPI